MAAALGCCSTCSHGSLAGEVGMDMLSRHMKVNLLKGCCQTRRSSGIPKTYWVWKHRVCSHGLIPGPGGQKELWACPGTGFSASWCTQAAEPAWSWTAWAVWGYLDTCLFPKPYREGICFPSYCHLWQRALGCLLFKCVCGVMWLGLTGIVLGCWGLCKFRFMLPWLKWKNSMEYSGFFKEKGFSALFFCFWFSPWELEKSLFSYS